MRIDDLGFYRVQTREDSTDCDHISILLHYSERARRDAKYLN